MNKLSIFASMMMMMCLPMMAQKNGSKAQVNLIRTSKFISVSDSRTWRAMPPSKTSTGQE